MFRSGSKCNKDIYTYGYFTSFCILLTSFIKIFINDVQNWIPLFEEVKFTWASRKINIPADILAKANGEAGDLINSFDFVPSCITSALHYDYFASS